MHHWRSLIFECCLFFTCTTFLYISAQPRLAHCLLIALFIYRPLSVHFFQFNRPLSQVLHFRQAVSMETCKNNNWNQRTKHRVVILHMHSQCWRILLCRVTHDVDLRLSRWVQRFTDMHLECFYLNIHKQRSRWQVEELGFIRIHLQLSHCPLRL